LKRRWVRITRVKREVGEVIGRDVFDNATKNCRRQSRVLFLARLLRAPNSLSPYKHPEKAL
jgi:hypothetical protein